MQSWCVPTLTSNSYVGTFPSGERRWTEGRAGGTGNIAAVGPGVGRRQRQLGQERCRVRGYDAGLGTPTSDLHHT